MFAAIFAIVSMAATAAEQYSKEVNAANQRVAAARQSEIREGQYEAQASVAINQRTRKARRERSRIMVAAAGADVSIDSPSVEMQLLDSLQQQERDTALIDKQEQWNEHALQAQRDSLMNRFSGPSTFGSALQVANAGLSSYRRAGGTFTS